MNKDEVIRTMSGPGVPHKGAWNGKIIESMWYISKADTTLRYRTVDFESATGKVVRIECYDGTWKEN